MNTGTAISSFRMADIKNGEEQRMYEYGKRIGFSECDTNRRLSVTSLIDVFQDCSTFQSEDAGAGYYVLEKLHLVWVVNYWELQIETLPYLCDNVTVGTFPYSFKGCFGMRNFYMKDAEGRYIVKANSMWTIIDTETVKPVKAPDFIRESYTIEEKLDMDYNPRKVLVPDGDDYNIVHPDPITIQIHHLDSNHHMNNGQYVKLAMSSITDMDISSLRIDYRKQAMLGDEIFPVVYEKNNERIVALNDRDGNPFSVSEYIGRIN